MAQTLAKDIPVFVFSLSQCFIVLCLCGIPPLRRREHMRFIGAHDGMMKVIESTEVYNFLLENSALYTEIGMFVPDLFI